MAAGPMELAPVLLNQMGVELFNSFDEALDQRPDVVMMLRVQMERMQHQSFSAPEYQRSWSLDETRLERLGPEAVILHPGPMNRGLEISNHAAEDSRSKVLEQVQNGLAVRMAVLHQLLGGQN